MGTHWHIALLTSDRWLSESIESQLVESREEPEALLLEELRDLDWSEGEVAIRHFRDDSKQYVFESTLAVRGAPGELSRVWTLLAAYERTFSQLGEMSSGEGG
ncbi:MAG: hypothetical protein EXS03_04290 [Phycisphaerales bacterium]|nr:hypothetical protein [Phycisphaerales bacterium]